VTVPNIQLIAAAHEMADASARVIMPYFRSRLPIENKATGDRFDPVTAADKVSEEIIRSEIKARFPDHDILGEEFATHTSNSKAPARYRWVIDPIDGTRAFILGLPTWGTLIGIEDEGQPIIGLMNQPFTHERYWSDGSGAFYRDPDGTTKPLKTRNSSLATAQLSTTAPELFSAGAEQKAFAKVKSSVRAHRYGGDCYAYCLLAAGHIDIVIEAGLNSYDIVALIPIIEQAGGIITNWDGGPAAQGGRILACGDPIVHAQALEVITAAIN